MDVSAISRRFSVRVLGEDDVSEIHELCSKNRLYYQYCPPFVSKKSIIEDMTALPPKKGYSDKFYIGFYDGEKLTAVMDLIRGFPDSKTAFIGFFMTDVSVQNAGIGSSIIDELSSFLKDEGFSYIRLGRAEGNPQAEHFWRKNGFVETGITYETDLYRVIVAQKEL